jgi:hypothetical protein
VNEVLEQPHRGVEVRVSMSVQSVETCPPAAVVLQQALSREDIGLSDKILRYPQVGPNQVLLFVGTRP